MDDRDWKLLDRQMKNFSPPRRREELMILILAVGFLAGITAGSFFFETQQSRQTAHTNGAPALAFFFDGSRTAAR
jgi:hypothetical protein